MGVTELETDGCLGIAMFFHSASPSHQSKAKQRFKGKSTLLHEIGTSLNCKIQRSFQGHRFSRLILSQRREVLVFVLSDVACNLIGGQSSSIT